MATNNHFMEQALAAKHIFDKCVPTFPTLSKVSLANKKYNEIIDADPIIRITNQLFYTNYSLNIAFDGRKFQGKFMRFPFSSAAHYIRILNQLEDSFFKKLYFFQIRIAFFKLGDYEIQKKKLIFLINRIMSRTSKLAEITIHFFYGLNMDSHYLCTGESKYVPSCIIDSQAIIELICELQVKTVEKIEIQCTYLQVHIEILENWKTFQDSLQGKFKNFKKCFLNIKFEYETDRVYKRRLTKALGRLNSSTFVLSLNCTDDNLIKELFEYEAILEKIGRKDCIKIHHMTHAYEMGYLQIIDSEVWLDHEFIRFNLAIEYFLSGIFLLENVNIYKNLRQINLITNNLFFLKTNAIHPEDMKMIKFRLQFLTNLRCLNVNILAPHTHDYDFLFCRLKGFVCSFPSTIEHLDLALNFSDMTYFNYQLALAYPNLKTFDFKFNVVPESLPLPKIEYDFFMSFPNLDLLQLPCFNDLKLVFPKTIKKIFITCCLNMKTEKQHNLSMAYFNKELGKVHNNIKQLNAEIMDGMGFQYEKCQCSNEEPILKHLYIQKTSDHMVYYTHLRNIGDLSIKKVSHSADFLTKEECGINLNC